MSDAAAFFANKKKKKTKKAFKFNANLVDANSVSPAVHVEAPALSNEQDVVAETPESNDKNNGEWEDEAVVAATTTVRNNTESNALRDFKTQGGGGVDSNNIAAKLRVQETKAQLENARKGMEREAEKLKEEKLKKEKVKEEASQSRFGAAASMGVGGGGKWVPSRMRSAAASGGLASQMRGAGGGKLDVEDEELFPDLAAADKILEKKEKEAAPTFKPAKKTPVGGGASWASKMNKKSEPKAEPQPEAAPASTSEPISEAVRTESTPTPAAAPTPEAAKPSVPVVKKTLTKKKKKDLSTFKPGS